MDLHIEFQTAVGASPLRPSLDSPFLWSDPEATSLGSLERQLGDLLETALAATALPAGAIYVLAETGNQLNRAVQRNLPAVLAPPYINYRPGEGIIGRAIAGRRPVIVSDAWADRTLGSAAESAGLRAQITLPLLSWGQPVGVLNLNARRPRTFSSDELQLLESLAGQAAAHVFNNRLFEHERGHRERLIRLFKLSSELATVEDVPVAMRLAARHILTATDAQAVTIYKLDEFGEMRLQMSLDREGQALQEDYPPGLSGTVHKWELDGQPLIVTGLGSNNVDQGGAGSKRPPFRAVVRLPLQSGGRTLGLLLVHYDHARTFLPEEIQALAFYAAQVGGAVERVGLLNEIRQLTFGLEPRRRLAPEPEPSPA